MLVVSREHLENALADAGLFDADVRSDYSGRGMYGSTCVGIVLDSVGDIGPFMFALGKLYSELMVEAGEQPWEGMGDELEGLSELPRRVSTDSMGLGTIVYFRGVKLANS